MRSRLLALTLGFYFCFFVLGCSKPADSNVTSDNGSNPTGSNPTGSNPTGSNPTGASAGSKLKLKPEAPKPVVLPAGTVLTVRLGQALGSKVSQSGQSFPATLAEAVQADAKDVIPAGANATGTVVDARPLGRFKGGASLEIKLVSINVNGTDQPIQTSSVARSEKGKGKRTAVLAGGGAGVGALIGGLAGGGKGAAIGLLAGGGAGTAGAAYTGNRDVVLPAESALSFKLEQPLEIK